jgi:hypothetical protein
MIAKLIGLCGLAGAGKNTVAELLTDSDRCSFHQLAFADPIYECIAVITGVSVAGLQNRDTKEAVIPWLGKSPRQMLQTLGTEWGRETVNPQIWIRIAIERSVPHLAVGRGVVITDVRFDNEAQAVIDAGGEVWKVIRPEWQCLDAGTAMHQSEAGVSEQWIARTIVNSGSLDDLRRQLLAATI